MKEQRLIRLLAALLIALVAFTAGAVVMKLAATWRVVPQNN